MGGEAALELAAAAMAAGDVDAARTHLEAAVEADAGAEAWELLGGVAMLDDDLALARRALETAFRRRRDDGQRRQAALVAATLADLHTTWFGNRIAGQGWVGRARRLLDGEGPCVERGYVDLALVACDADDITKLEEAGASALVLARDLGDTDLEVRALADTGYALVVQGRIEEGFERLDEAMAALSAGEVRNPGVAGMSFCALLAACDRTGDVGRAEEWTRVISTAMTAPLGERPKALHMHCRLAHGSVLCTAGRLEEGEAELTAALGPDASVIRVHQGEAAARLASVRLLQGRVEEAAALVGPFEDRPGACEPLARIHLAKGDLELADAVARRGLGMVAGDCLRSGALRALLVEIALAGDDLDAASEHVEALEDLATCTSCRLIVADAALAAARVAAARADAATALASLDRAQANLRPDERPALAAAVALERAIALADAGDRGAAIDQARAALTAFERLRATPSVDRTNALLRSLGAAAGLPRRSAGAAVAGLTEREQQVLALIREGLTNAEIGRRLFVSPKTAEHHVGRVLGKLGVRSRAEAAAIAAAAAPHADPKVTAE